MSHKTEYFDEEFCFKCKFCSDVFWSQSERLFHVGKKHASEAKQEMARCQGRSIAGQPEEEHWGQKDSDN